MSQENINLINRIYREFNQRNYSAVLEFFDTNFEWIAADNSPLADRSPYHGLDKIREWVFNRIAAGTEKLIVDINEIFGAENKVVMLGYYESIYKLTSKQSRSQVAHVWTITNGKVVKFQQYLDTYQVAQNAQQAASS